MFEGVRENKRLIEKLCIIELVSWGILYYAFSALLPPMQTELGWSSAMLAGGFSLALVVSGAAAPFVGQWLDRYDSRWLMASGGCVGSVGIGLWSISYVPWMYFVAWALIGLAMASTLYAPAFATVVRWRAKQHRSGILRITLVGGLASTVFLPLSIVLSEYLGWRGTLALFAGCMALVVTPLALTLPRLSVSARGSEKREPKKEPLEGAPSASPKNYFFVVSLMIAEMGSAAFNAYIIVFLIHAGIPLSLAAAIAGMSGIAKVLGRVMCILGERYSALYLLQMSMFGNAIALGLPLFWPTTIAVSAMVLIFGMASGARTILRPVVLIERYGTTRFGKRNGLLQLFTTFSKALGPVGFGVAVATGGEQWSWALLAIVIALGGALLSAMPDSEIHKQKNG